MTGATRLMICERWIGRTSTNPNSPCRSNRRARSGLCQGDASKEQLQDGQYYWGICRNARVAQWSAKHQLFFHQRKKFEHWYVESIPHPVDEKTSLMFNKVVGFDIFVPWIEVEPLDFERVDVIPE
jgi:hypothetical protein